MPEMAFRLPRGTRDFLPEEMVKRDYVEAVIKRVFERYGFQRIETPIFETFALFALRSGEEIRSHMFVFTIDEGEMALRPELTAPVARMIALGEVDLSVRPLRFYYIGRCYRYEEPQAGRYREFWQAGIELIGSSRPEADAEAIALAVEVLEELGLKDYELRVGNLEVLRGFLNDSKVPEEIQNRIIGPLDILSSSLDKLRLYKTKLARGKKLSKEELADLIRRCDELRTWVESELLKPDSPVPKDMLERCEVDPVLYELEDLHERGETDRLVEFIEDTMGKLLSAQKLRWTYQGVHIVREDGTEEVFRIPPEVAEKLFSMMELVGAREPVLEKARELFKGSESALKALNDFERVLDALSWFGIEDYTVDLSIARGLEYYTGIVFEIDCPLLGAQKQICGGGRYDKLIEEFGGPSLPAVGFAFGFDRLVLALELSGAKFPSPVRADVYVVPISEEVMPYAIRVARELRTRGLRVELSLLRKRLREELSMANKLGIPFVAIAGPREAERNVITLRDMRAGQQTEASIEEAAELIKRSLGRCADRGGR